MRAAEGDLPGDFTCREQLPHGLLSLKTADGTLVLVRDTSELAAHRRTVNGWLWGLFGIGAFLLAAATLVLERLIERKLLDDLRAEREELALDGQWTEARLRQLVSAQLRATEVTVVSNREPYIHTRNSQTGEVKVQHPASGVVTALEPVMRACGGTWVAHASGSADREHSDPKGRLRVPPGEEAYTLRRVWLTPEEEAGYYYGFSNEGLWPLCHLVHTRPDFKAEDFAKYRDVNARFADAVAEETKVKDPVILVQDYHFALLPKMLTDRMPHATVVTFWHIPWPSAERFGICPWRDELLEGALGASIVGFHTQQHCNNFLEACDRFLEARLDRESNAVVRRGRQTLVRPYPISVEWPNRWVQKSPPVDVCRKELRAELGFPEDTLLGVGVDRLDYTKGFEERVQAVERMLDRNPHLVGKFSFVQFAAPTRSSIPQYKALNDRLEALVEKVNAKFAQARVPPVKLLRAHHEPPAVFRAYRAADLCYVSSLHDGMNLVAKEFVAARDDEQGVLVLSSFTGAARELTEALVVNPYDLDEAADAMRTALEMKKSEQKGRMHAMRAQVKEFNVYRWAGRMLIDVVRQRRHARFSPLKLVSQAA
ncbi:MAG: trehalose-6-phosphate synthase [Archangiaceae bacterium]|nr:trehalose-6-phosphate synthase [Archangiaceae bacterium]